MGSAASPLTPLTFWYNANGTSDHHHQLNPAGSNLSSLENCPTGQGNTECGFPFEGQGVLGCWKGNGADGNKEWAGIQLSEPMEAGACYKISFWIQNKKDEPGNEYITNQWGMFFDHTEIPFFNPSIANFASMSDHWVACEEVIDGSEWKKLEFDYQASEDFAYAYIGYMGDYSTSTFSIANDDFLLGFYVWIDEVSVTRIDPQLTLSEDISICRGETVLLEAVSNFPIKWEDNNSSATSRSVSPDSTTVYYVQTLDSTLCAIRDSIVVSIIDEQVVDFSGANICAGAAPLMLDSSVGSGTWSGTGIIDNSQGIFDPALAGIGAFAIQYVSDADCSENFTMMVTVDSVPDIDMELDQLEGCAPLEVYFDDLSPNPGVAYDWDFGNGMFSTDLLSTYTVYTEPGSYDVNLEVVYSENCKSSLYLPNLIEVFESPEASFTYAPNNPSNLEPTVQFENTSEGNMTEVFWDFGNGNTSDAYNPQTIFDTPGIYDVQLQVFYNGCVDSTSQKITVNSKVNFFIPNAFSPNGDGINDHFKIHSRGLITDYEMTIFHRQGGTLFKSNSIDDSWDGSTPNGQPCSSGVYVYLIKYKYQGLDNDLFIDGQQAGDITILR